MTNELKERLEALSADLTEAKSHGNVVSSTILGAALQELLVSAFKAGDLITRQELDEAVAAEREACAALCDSAAESRLRQIKESDSSYIQNERWRCGKQQSQILADAIRARSEQKGGA